MLPQGMFSVAIATVLFPTLSRLASRGDLRAFADTVSNGLRQIAFLLAPTAVVSAVLAEPIIRILYQRGHWHPAQTPVVAGALAAFSAGLVFNGFMLMLNRAFFSLQSNWIPTWVALGNLGAERDPRRRLLPVRDVGDPARDRRLQRRRRRSRSSCCCAAGSAGSAAPRSASRSSKIFVAAALVAPVAYAIWRPLDSALGRSFPAQVVSLGLALAAAAGVYLGGLSRAPGARVAGATLLA